MKHQAIDINILKKLLRESATSKQISGFFGVTEKQLYDYVEKTTGTKYGTFASNTKRSKDVDWTMAANLFGVFCTCEEVAYMLNCSVDTLDRHCQKIHKMGIDEWANNCRNHGRASLRKAQYNLAIAGNHTMQIWLGKQYLGQRDNKEEETEDKELTISYD